MKKNNLLFIFIFIFVLGGIVFLTIKNKNDVQKNAKSEVNTRGSLRSMFALGPSRQCTFSDSRIPGIFTINTIYLNTNGDMHGDFELKSDPATDEVEHPMSHSIIKGNNFYSWGEVLQDNPAGLKPTGIKFVFNTQDSDGKFASNAELFFNNILDLDIPMDYSCKSWTVDESKFVPPADVIFNDLDAEVQNAIPKDPNIPKRVVAGYIAGHVNIGPNCPVEQIDNPCPPPPQAYFSREVIVYEKNGVTINEKGKIDASGNFKIAVGPGNYLVQIKPAGIGEGEKKSVTVKSFETSTVDFDIDTGIR